MIKTKTYPNALRLVVETNPNSLSTGCLFRFDVATLNEKEGEQGYAHFLEHMLAGESSNKRSMKELNNVFEMCGAQTDATTSFDTTEYSFISLNEDFDKCFEAQCEGLFDNAFLEHECEREKKVIIQEHGDEDVFGGLIDMLIDSLYKGQYTKFIEGDKKSIQNIDLEKLKAFYKREYIPSNLTISICGNKTFDQVEKLVEDNIFDKIDKNTLLEKTPPKQISRPTSNIFLENKSSDVQSQVLMLFPADLDCIASTVFVSSLQNYCGRLYEKLRIEEPLVYEVSIYGESSLNTMIVHFACSHNNVPTCLRKIREVFEDIAENGLTNEELVSSKAKIQLEVIQCKDSVDFRAAFNALPNEENPQTIEEMFQEYKNVTNQEVKDFAKSILNTKYAIGEQGKYADVKKLYAFDPALAPTKPTPRKPKYISKFSKFLKTKKTTNQDNKNNNEPQLPKSESNDKTNEK